MVAYARCCASGGFNSLGRAIIGALGVVILVPGVIASAIGIPLIFIGVGKISDAQRPEHQLDFDAPGPTAPPRKTAPPDERWWIVRKRRPDPGRRSFMMNLRFCF